MTAWFKRAQKKLTKAQKRSIPDGVWVKCKSCSESLYNRELERNLLVCPGCGYHFRMSSLRYIELLLEPESWTEFDAEIVSEDIMPVEGTNGSTNR